MVIGGNYFSLKSDLKRMRLIIDECFKGEIRWLNKYFRICDRETKKLVRLEKKKDVKFLILQLLECVSCSKLINFLDNAIASRLIKMSKELNIPYAKILTRIKPIRDTQLIKYKKNLGNLKDEKIDDFLRKYKWVGTRLFTGKPLSRQQIKYELKKILKNKNKEIIYDIPPQFDKIVKIASELTYQRTNLSEVIIRVSFSYWGKFKYILEKNKLKFSDLRLFTYFEFIDLLEKGKYPKDLHKRKNKFGIEFISGNCSVFTGDEVIKKMHLELKLDDCQLKGIPSNFGHINGIVKIIRCLSDVAKIKKGNIVVASEITTDYIPMLNRVSAIITEQGGITSHAAIIARELGKPCIIGVKNATKILKNNDKIELDAEKGIINKI